ncbi:pyrroline-5-carboxylate reductase [Pseudomonas capeferrum]|uniref:pyrroline-5-carboxylate reductase n=1 Tax=Pseudomonas capeferrum TaxID=1495066 RepID=UPI0030DB18C0
MTHKVAFIGGGKMATALIGGIITNGTDPRSIYVYDPNTEQCRLLSDTFGVNATSLSNEVPTACDCIIWAVKPQSLRNAAEALIAKFSSALHISIAAGIRIKTLQTIFQSRRVIRAMPNTPALIGAGVTALFSGDAVTEHDKNHATLILQSTGYTFWVEDDQRMDAVTALSGSGPGYVFHFIESLINSAIALGFNADDARKLTLLTMQGSVAQALESTDSVSLLRQAVTSPGGTTEAGLSVMNQWRIHDAMVATLQSACSRAAELGDEFELSIHELSPAER